MEDINSLLNSGEVPNIYDNEEKKKIIEDLRPYNASLNRVGNLLFSLFISIFKYFYFFNAFLIFILIFR